MTDASRDECRFDRHGLCVKHPWVVDGPIVLEGAPPMLCDVAAAALRAERDQLKKQYAELAPVAIELREARDRLAQHIQELEGHLENAGRLEGRYALKIVDLKSDLSRAEATVGRLREVRRLVMILHADDAKTHEGRQCDLCAALAASGEQK